SATVATDSSLELHVTFLFVAFMAVSFKIGRRPHRASPGRSGTSPTRKTRTASRTALPQKQKNRQKRQSPRRAGRRGPLAIRERRGIGLLFKLLQRRAQVTFAVGRHDRHDAFALAQSFGDFQGGENGRAGG